MMMMMMKIQVMVFWIMTPCSDMAGYQHFGWPCCLPLRVKVIKNIGNLHKVCSCVRHPFFMSFIICIQVIFFYIKTALISLCLRWYINHITTWCRNTQDHDRGIFLCWQWFSKSFIFACSAPETLVTPPNEPETVLQQCWEFTCYVT